jgi:hypothetical protein
MMRRSFYSVNEFNLIMASGAISRAAARAYALYLNGITPQNLKH